MKALDALAKRYADRVDSVSDERGDDQGLWVYLKSGWHNSACDKHNHTIHEDTIKELTWQVKAASACDCEHCEYDRTLAIRKRYELAR
jgi:hypothetical protein